MLVERSRYDEAVEQARIAAETIRVDVAAKDGDHIGPLVSHAQREKVRALIRTGIDGDGARLVTGGVEPPDGLASGCFVRPTVFADCTAEMTIMREEIFGPVLSMMPFDTEAEAISLANDTDYGLTNYVQTGDAARAVRVADRLRSGMVEVNGHAPVARSPFGGYKRSGNGREGGRWGIEEFLETKAIRGRPGDDDAVTAGTHLSIDAPVGLHIGFIGLGNVGGKLAGSLLRNGVTTSVLDIDAAAMRPLLDAGARPVGTAAAMGRDCDVVITCLPAPAISAAIVEGPDGLLQGLTPGTIWAEMSTTDEAEVIRLGARVSAAGGEPVDCPVSGGCHRAATGNIAIFAGAERRTFERLLPVLTILGRRVLHTGPLGSASVLKVVTNYLATANLLTLCEALTVSSGAGMDLATAYEAIRLSSGNSFVHETESQVILNGSRDIDFTMDLVLKDIGLFQAVADRGGVALEINPLLIDIMSDGATRYGARANSPSIIRRLEEASGQSVLAPGFPASMSDDEPEARGTEVVPRGRS